MTLFRKPLHSNEPFIPLPSTSQNCRIFTFSTWKNVTELLFLVNIKFVAVAKFPLDKVKP